MPDSKDNCPDVQNPSQDDSDNDGVGDACTGYSNDLDGDTIADTADNCMFVANPDQADADNNGIGDVCEKTPETDTDGDTIPDDSDNCPDLQNADQKDSNNDGIGDACTPVPVVDTDGDTIPDDKDNCPNDANPDQKDSNNDGKGDACTPVPVVDTDGDTIPDDKDNCPKDANPDQKDSNKDGKGDACTPASQADGSAGNPFIISSSCGSVYRDSRDTSQSKNSLIDVYPNDNKTNESGPEYYYKLTVSQRSTVSIWLDAEPSGVDIDIQLLRNVNISNKTVPSSDFIARDDKSLSSVVEAGTYWIVADTYNGAGNAGKYTINVQVMPEYVGTKSSPILLNCGNPLPNHFVFTDVRNTANSTSSVFNSYPGHENTNESGPEYIYKFTLNERARFHATIRKPEPDGTDIDIHLLSSLDPKLIARDDARVWRTLDPGTYYISADSYNGMKGKYVLDVQVRPVAVTGDQMFNAYVLKAVDWLRANWGTKGYADSAYTHDLPYGSGNKVPKGPKAPRTMCVAAVAETILVAMDLYAQETNDTSVWNHIPWKSWYNMSAGDMRTCMWVNHTYKCEGSGDALTLFGMGMTVPFEELVPGSFVNINRTSGYGHAVVFISFLDANCKEYETYNEKVVGFKYFSSQGSYDTGGFDYRYAVFDGKSMATCPKYHDTGVIRSNNQLYLNTGVMYMPKYWLKTTRAQGL